VANNPAEAKAATSHLGGRAVIKAQIHAGGRGKAGGVKVASSPEQAESIAASLIGRRLVTHQTRPSGVPVSKVLVEEVIDMERELYLAIAVDSSQRLPVVMAGEAGGVDIEDTGLKSPGKIIKTYVDPVAGFQPFQGRLVACGLNLEPPLVRPASDLTANLFHLFQAKDCSLAEINPLAVTRDGRLVAVDAKLNFDDHALYRHPDTSSLHDPEQEDPLEAEATRLGIRNYVKLDGNIGCVINGAGLGMAVLDLLSLAGGRPANFLDIGTANNTQRVVNAFRLLKSDPDVRAILVNIFGGLARADIIAQGIVQAFRQMEITAPVVVRLAGTNVQEGERILKESGLKLIRAHDMQEAAEKAIAASRQTDRLKD
jgi:succinyl-CoA synthetase beta subunit